MNTQKGLIDIGANLSHQSFVHDLPQVLSRAQEAGLEAILVTGTDLPSSCRAVELATEYPGFLYATAGLHPHHADAFSVNMEQELRQLARHETIRAIGETGLDFYRNYSPPAQQEHVLERMLEWAAESGMPLFLHERAASTRMYAMLHAIRSRLGKVVIHCFTGEREALFRYLDLDLHIGITGWVCDPRRGAHLHPLLAEIPPGRLMIESDAPWLLPKNRRVENLGKQGRNEPAALPYIVQEIALHCGRSAEELARETTATARDFFSLSEASESRERLT